MDARNVSIPPCCPGSHHENRAAVQRTPQGETDRRYVAPEHATHARGLLKPMPDEAMHRHARREISLAKVRADDPVAVEQTCARVVPHAANSREVDS